MPALAGCAKTGDKTIVSVNGEKITKSALDNRLESQAGKTTLQQMVDTAIVPAVRQTGGHQSDRCRRFKIK